MKKNIKRSNRGFSLIEIAIVMIVLGLLISGIMHSLKATAVQKRIDQTNEAVFAITDGLSKFLSENGRYPCPASLDIAQSEAGYGEELTCSDTTDVETGECGNGYCVVESPSDPNARIRIGAIPGKTLDIDKKHLLDSRNNKFTYAVTETQATANFAEGNGKIHLLDAEEIVDPLSGRINYNPIVTNNVDMVFFSHGDTQAGAYTGQGVLNAFKECSGSWTDVENCDGDGTFVTKNYSMSDAATGPYDDTLVSNIFSWIYVWDKTFSSDENIYNRDTGNLGIGTGLDVSPDEKLHLLKGNMRVDGRLEAEAVCQEDGSNCFDPDLLGGDGMHCDPTKEFMFGIQSSNALCRNALNNSVGGCRGTIDFMTGISTGEGGISQATCEEYLGTRQEVVPIRMGSIGPGRRGPITLPTISNSTQTPFNTNVPNNTNVPFNTNLPNTVQEPTPPVITNNTLPSIGTLITPTILPDYFNCTRVIFSTSYRCNYYK